MKRSWTMALLIGILVVGLLAIAGCSSGGSNSGSTSGGGSTGGGSTGGTSSSSATVVAKNFTFSPGSVQVSVGGTVTWKNEDSTTHNVEGDGGISSGDLAPGASYSKTFNTAGTYNYHCIIHPSMTGTVVVK